MGGVLYYGGMDTQSKQVKQRWLQVRVTDMEHAQFAAAAKRRGMSLSEYVRRSAETVERLGLSTDALKPNNQ